MRLFVAINFFPEFLNPVTELIRELRSMAGGIKWVNPENLHLTLRFIGEVPDKLSGEISTALGGIDFPQFIIRTTGQIGFFPPGVNPKVIWLAVDKEGETRMQELAAMINGTLMNYAGINPDTKPFKGHLTLGRVRRDRKLDRSACEYMVSTQGPLLDQRVRSLDLVKSVLTPAGPVYSVINSFTLRRTDE